MTSALSNPDRNEARLRWTAFALAGGAFLLSFFHRIAPAAIASELQLAFQASGTALGALAATYFYVYTVMQLPVGVLADTLGPRRIIVAGNVLAGAGSIAFGMAETIEAAAFGRTLTGLGVSFAFISLLKLNASWFHERQFTTVSGASQLLGNLGAVLSAAPLAWAVGWVSWRSVFVAVGAVSLAMAALTWRLMRDSPAAAGLAPLHEARHESAAGARWYHGLWIVVSNRATWPGFWTALGMGGSYMAFVGLWAVPYLTQAHGMSRQTAAAHTTLALVSFAVGAAVIGGWCDRLARRKPLVIGGAAIYVLCWLAWLTLPWLPLPASFALCAAMGASVNVFLLCLAGAKDVNPPPLAGMAMSVVNTGIFLGAGILQPLVGRVLDADAAGALAGHYGPAAYHNSLLVLLGAAVFGLVAALFVRETRCRNIWPELSAARRIA